MDHQDLYKPEFLGSLDLQEIAEGIKRELHKTTVNKVNVGMGLLQIKETKLYQQKEGCYSFNRFLEEFADREGVSPSTLYNWLGAAHVVRRYPIYFESFDVDPLSHFSKLIHLQKALKFAPEKLEEIMEALRAKGVREFKEYVKELYPSYHSIRRSGDTSDESWVSSIALTNEVNTIYNGMIRGTLIVVLGVQNQGFERHLKDLIRMERRRSAEYGRNNRRIRDVDPDNPFEILSLNMSIEELEERVKYGLHDISYHSGIVALGIFLIHDSYELRTQIKNRGFNDPSSYCEHTFGISSSAVYWYKQCGEALIEYQEELKRSGFKIQNGLYKLAFLKKALERYNDRETVFGALVRMSYSGFEEFATGKDQSKVQLFSPRIQRKAKPYINRLNLIKARGEMPAVFELYYEWEKSALLYFYSQYRDSELNKPQPLYLPKAE